VKKLAVLGAAAAVIYLASHSGAITSVTAAHGPVTRNANEALANSMAASGYGWTGSETTCLDELWTHESGFDAYAANPSSDARGIPQRITGWGGDYQPGAAAAQVRWGLSYIHGKYGTPCAAWHFETSHSPNWY
jgi:hypothetical protein